MDLHPFDFSSRAAVESAAAQYYTSRAWFHKDKNNVVRQVWFTFDIRAAGDKSQMPPRNSWTVRDLTEREKTDPENRHGRRAAYTMLGRHAFVPPDEMKKAHSRAHELAHMMVKSDSGDVHDDDTLVHKRPLAGERIGPISILHKYVSDKPDDVEAEVRQTHIDRIVGPAVDAYNKDPRAMCGKDQVIEVNPPPFTPGSPASVGRNRRGRGPHARESDTTMSPALRLTRILLWLALLLASGCGARTRGGDASGTPPKPEPTSSPELQLPIHVETSAVYTGDRVRSLLWSSVASSDGDVVAAGTHDLYVRVHEAPDVVMWLRDSECLRVVATVSGTIWCTDQNGRTRMGVSRDRGLSWGFVDLDEVHLSPHYLGPIGDDGILLSDEESHVVWSAKSHASERVIRMTALRQSPGHFVPDYALASPSRICVQQLTALICTPDEGVSWRPVDSIPLSRGFTVSDVWWVIDHESRLYHAPAGSTAWAAVTESERQKYYYVTGNRNELFAVRNDGLVRLSRAGTMGELISLGPLPVAVIDASGGGVAITTDCGVYLLSKDGATRVLRLTVEAGAGTECPEHVEVEIR